MSEAHSRPRRAARLLERAGFVPHFSFGHRPDLVIIGADRASTLSSEAELDALCATAVREARLGQTIILCTTRVVGDTQRLLVEPLESEGFRLGIDIFVAFATPSTPLDGAGEPTPWVIGSSCLQSLGRAQGAIAHDARLLPSFEAAERAALAEAEYREFEAAWLADATAARAIECHRCTDREDVSDAHARLHSIVHRSMRLLESRVENVALATVIIAGIPAHDPSRVGGSTPALEIIEALMHSGVDVRYYDPMITWVEVFGTMQSSTDAAKLASADLVIWNSRHSGMDPYALLEQSPLVLDLTDELVGAGVHRA